MGAVEVVVVGGGVLTADTADREIHFGRHCSDRSARRRAPGVAAGGPVGS